MYDYLIVGAGFYGSICAHELRKKGYKCLVIDKKSHIGGNCYTELKDNINIHKYGPHIFHTSNEDVWKWINQFVDFNNFILQPLANYKGEIYPLPFNMYTFSKLLKITHPDQAARIIKYDSEKIQDPKNLEEQAIKLVGKKAYLKLIKGYTWKQWKKDPKDLPKEIIQRLPVRFTYDNNYFNDKYQGIPIGGYTQIFEKLLEGIEVKLNTDYFSDKDYFNSLAKNIVYTGPVDLFFDYKYGQLEYKSTEFEFRKINVSNYQGAAVMNYTDVSIPFTRCVEYKHFEKSDSDVTWVSYEYPVEYKAGLVDPQYPVNDKFNNDIYDLYKKELINYPNIHFGGRLAEYKYYDMDDVIESALTYIKTIKFN